MRHSALLDAVESIIGPDIFVYHLTCWIKEPGDGSFVSWHQDGTYFNLSAAEHVTAWIALSDATPESGCMPSPEEGFNSMYASLAEAVIELVRFQALLSA